MILEGNPLFTYRENQRLESRGNIDHQEFNNSEVDISNEEEVMQKYYLSALKFI